MKTAEDRRGSMRDVAAISVAEDARCFERALPHVFFLDSDCSHVSACCRDGAMSHSESACLLDPEIVARIRATTTLQASAGGRTQLQFVSGRKLVRVLVIDGDAGIIVIVEPVRNRTTLGNVAVKFSLSARECQVLDLIVRARSRATIAELLEISETTVQSHILNIGLKMNCSKREEMIARALGVY